MTQQEPGPGTREISIYSLREGVGEIGGHQSERKKCLPCFWKP